jgi:aromatic-L-amino-acid decarboxylase
MKWLATPMDCSCFWTRRPEELYRTFSAHPGYMPKHLAGVTDLKDYGPALGRRFRGLKLWTVLRCLGRDGLQAIVREHVRLAQLFASWVEQGPGWEVVAPHPLSIVCFRRDGSDEENEDLLERVNGSGEVFLSSTRLGGKFVLRLAIGNMRTTEGDVCQAWDVLRACVD